MKLSLPRTQSAIWCHENPIYAFSRGVPPSVERRIASYGVTVLKACDFEGHPLDEPL